jgi:dihydrofolate reductase
MTKEAANMNQDQDRAGMVPPRKPFTVIAAYDQSNRGIGAHQTLSWHVPPDLHFFRKVTTRTRDSQKQNAVILGRRTWEGMGCRLLPGRFHVCLSSQTPAPPYPDPTRILVAPSLSQALDMLSRMPTIESIFVIGGARVYQEAIRHPQCAEIWVNELVFADPPTSHYDAFFPEIPADAYAETELTPAQTPLKTEINSTQDTNVQIIPRRFVSFRDITATALPTKIPSHACHESAAATATSSPAAGDEDPHK